MSWICMGKGNPHSTPNQCHPCKTDFSQGLCPLPSSCPASFGRLRQAPPVSPSSAGDEAQYSTIEKARRKCMVVAQCKLVQVGKLGIHAGSRQRSIPSSSETWVSTLKNIWPAACCQPAIWPRLDSPRLVSPCLASRAASLSSATKESHRTLTEHRDVSRLHIAIPPRSQCCSGAAPVCIVP